MNRTHYCGALRESEIGCKVTVCGWVLTKRDMGGIVFIDLRDREGTLQVVFDAGNLTPDEFKIADGLKNQSVIEVTGLIRKRGEETYNPKLATGTIELAASNIKLLSNAETIPFALDDSTDVREDLRLKYRFLDLRRPQMYKNLKFRHDLVKVTRDYLDNDGFLEVETPMMMKSTPEGARDYLVPSRVHPGKFYALPQSPQIYKQLLMVGGIDKYYQVARCFRDEDLRADRQPEFTQVDMEMSFVNQEDVLTHLEKLFKYIMKNLMNEEINEPFLRLTWHQAMDWYGSDKPDLRFDLKIIDLTEIARTCSFSVFRSVVDKGGIVRAINVPGGADFTRSQIEELTAKAQSYGAKGMAWIAIRPGGEIYSILTKYFKENELQDIIKAMGAKDGDFILFCADKLATVRRTLGNLRIDVAEMLGIRDTGEYKFLFVTDFPQFEWSDEENRWMATHHPFTMPYEEDVDYLMTDPGRVRAQAYDVVLNGIELGSGSVRIHRQDIQTKMFEALGFNDAQIEERFGFMVNAFRYGTPPHAGFAFGLDRLTMQLLDAESLRDVIAFPKIKDASELMTGAPDFVDEEQLKVLGILVGDEAEKPASASNAKAKKASPTINVENVANLARLSLTDKEKADMPKEMGAIIDFANQLSELDTENVPITAHVVPISNIFREDKATNEPDRDALLANAPTKADGYFTVPRVVES
ncbi:MAG: aspartate--tRNA ligase [Clostridiales bacterium]|nr:aspartate--tRNA ligase [Clostridiales bacterium]